VNGPAGSGPQARIGSIDPRRILIVEDVAETRAWLCEVVGSAFPHAAIREAAHLEAARSLLEKGDFDLALIDIHLPDGSGIDLLREIGRRSPQTYCVIATVFGDDEHLFEALRAGARGYLLKEQSSEQLIRHLRGITEDQPPLSPSIARRVLQFFRPLECDALTPREVDVLSLLARGLRLKDVAAELGISAHTVGDHVKSIYRKLQVGTRAEATLQAVRRGLVPPSGG
jgi:DNA-binding NarL/FixJ family response regulator